MNWGQPPTYPLVTYGLAAVLLFLWSCNATDLDELDFFEVRTRAPQPSDLFGCVDLEGAVVNLGSTPLDEFGFIYSASADSMAEPDLGFPRLSSSDLPETGVFTETFLLPDANTPLFFRAFARSGPRTIFGETTVFAPELTLFTGSTQIDNNQITVEFGLFGLEALNSRVEQSGIAYAPLGGALPTIESGDTVQAGPQRTDGRIPLELSDLSFNTSYLLRPFVQTNKATYYGLPDTIRVRDGWEAVAELPINLKGGIAISNGNVAVVGAGCPQGICISFSNYNPRLWRFSIATDDQSVNWTEFPPIGSAIFPAERMVSFTIGETIYLGLGEFQEGASLPFPQSSFIRLNINEPNPTWEQLLGEAAFPGAPRSGAVAFVINGKAYVGAGGGVEATPDGDVPVFYNDFYEFDPEGNNGQGSWREVAGLFIQAAIGEPVFYNGRKDAVAFALSNAGIVGGGVQGGLTLTDFWRFSPPTNPQDTGRWELHSFFPGDGRVGASACTTDGRYFYGLGEASNNRFFEDWWEFVPNEAPHWRRKTDFQGGRRSLALSFGLGTWGYVGTGRTTVLNEEQTGFNIRIFKDFWRYYPERN